MKRVMITGFLALVFGASWQSLAIHLPLWLNLFFLPPVILVFSLQYFRPLETIFVSLFGGLITDILGGFMIGSNMLLMLIAAFVLGAFNVFSGRVGREELAYYVVAISFLYRVVFLIAHLVFLGAKANILVVQLFIGPMVDGLMSILFYRVLVKFLGLVRAFDQSDYFRNRIGLGR